MDLGIGVIIGVVLGSLWTAWVMQRCRYVMPVIPMSLGKARVFTPTEIDRAKKNERIIREAKQRQADEEAREWAERTGLSPSLKGKP